MKVQIFTPTHSGAVQMETAMSMVQGTSLLALADINFEWKVQAGGCFMHVIRDRAAREFLESDCTDLVFLDDDIGFDADAILKLLAHEKLVVGAPCVKRKDDSELVLKAAGPQEGDLLPVQYIGTGLLRIHNTALHMVFSEYGRCFDIIWDSGGNAMGEDIWFSRACTAVGIQPWADMSINTSHTGRKVWTNQKSSA